MSRTIYVLFIITLLGSSCSSSRKVVKFPSIHDEAFANSNLKAIFKSNKNPNIVLRVPNTNDRATSNTSTSAKNDILYNAIEKQLLRKGFSVRDRGLFNELISKSQNTDYSKIKDLTDTDIILEVVNINPAVLYSTNKVTVISKRKETDQLGYIQYKEQGASVEYKVILVKNNEIAGSYKFHYIPCENGCEVSSFRFSGKKRNKKLVLREGVEFNIMEEFMKNTTDKLIASFRI